MIPKNIPSDINIELLLSYFKESSCKVSFSGHHKRNAYSDLMELEEKLDGSLLMSIGRTSLYNTLPELMFHPIDRFDYLPAQNEKERFEEEYVIQEREKENAHKFFAPIDLMLLQLRLDVREKMEAYAKTDKIMIDILGDELTLEQRQNRFVKQLLPFLPFCKTIRGNKTSLTLMLRKVFIEEGLGFKVNEENHRFSDMNPRYDESLGANLDALFVGNTFYEQATTYEILYWSKEECNEHFLSFINEVETLRLFVQDYFMAIDEILRFNISYDGDSVCLADETTFNYMNYNMNL